MHTITSNKLERITAAELGGIEGGHPGLIIVAGLVAAGAAAVYALYKGSGFKAEIGEDGLPEEEGGFRDGTLVHK